MNPKIFSFRFLAISLGVVLLLAVGISAVFASGGIQLAAANTSTAAFILTSQTGSDNSGKDSLSDQVDDKTKTPVPGMGAIDPARVCFSSASLSGESEFYANIEAINGSTYLIGGLTVTTSSLTELKAAFAVGNRVKVHATLQADGSYFAREIEPALAGEGCSTSFPGNPASTPAPGMSNEWEFYGTVNAIQGDLWTINGTIFTVNSTTYFDGQAVIGSRVEVKAYRQADGSWLAARIEVDDDDYDGNDDDDSYDDSDDDDSYDDNNDDDDSYDDNDDDDDDSDEDSGSGQ